MGGRESGRRSTHWSTAGAVDMTNDLLTIGACAACAYLALRWLGPSEAKGRPGLALDRLVLVGDSHVEALGPALKRLVAVEWLAKRGESVSSFAIKHGPTATELAKKSTLVLVSLGSNGEASAKDASDLHRKLTGSGSPVIWLPPPAEKGAKVAKALKEAGVPAFIWSAPSSLVRDGIHLTPEGYSCWAKEIWRTLKNRTA